MQERLDEGRWERIEATCYIPNDTDCPFTIEELRRCKHKGKDTTLGADGISYSMIANMGSGEEILFLGLINKVDLQFPYILVWKLHTQACEIVAGTKRKPCKKFQVDI